MMWMMNGAGGSDCPSQEYFCSASLFFHIMCSLPGWQQAVNKENCILCSLYICCLARAEGKSCSCTKLFSLTRMVSLSCSPCLCRKCSQTTAQTLIKSFPRFRHLCFQPFLGFMHVIKRKRGKQNQV